MMVLKYLLYIYLKPQLLKPTGLEPMHQNKRSHHNENPCPATRE